MIIDFHTDEFCTNKKVGMGICKDLVDSVWFSFLVSREQGGSSPKRVPLKYLRETILDSSSLFLIGVTFRVSSAVPYRK